MKKNIEQLIEKILLAIFVIVYYSLNIGFLVKAFTEDNDDALIGWVFSLILFTIILALGALKKFLKFEKD